MTIAEVRRAEIAAGGGSGTPASEGHPDSPLLSSAWLLRTAAVSAVLAGVIGVIVAPGLRGNAGEPAVVFADGASSALACFLMGALVALFLEGSLELFRLRERPVALRLVLVFGGAAVVALSGVALRDRIPPPFAVLIECGSIVVALAGAFFGARAPHTRAVAGVLLALAFAAIVRLGAWEMATRAGETANVSLFGSSRLLATTGVLLEAAGQLVAVLWLSTRGRWAGHLGLVLALAGAVALTYGVAHGVHSGAPSWQAVVHSSLADASGVPPPYRLGAFATFLVASSLLLAFVTAVQPNVVTATVAAMALALVSRGAFDAPLRALCAVVSAQWIAVASVDSRAMWRALIGDRARRLVDER